MSHPITYRVGKGVPVPRRRRFVVLLPMLALAVLVTVAMVVLAII